MLGAGALTNDVRPEEKDVLGFQGRFGGEWEPSRCGAVGRMAVHGFLYLLVGGLRGLSACAHAR